MKKTAAPTDLSNIIRRCVSNPAVLQFILDIPFSSLELDPVPSSITPSVNLLTAVAVGIIENARVPEAILNPVLDTVKRGLKVKRNK